MTASTEDVPRVRRQVCEQRSWNSDVRELLYEVADIRPRASGSGSPHTIRPSGERAILRQ